MISASGTVIASCSCGECRILVATEDRSTEEWVPAGRESTAVFDSMGIVDIEGSCEEATVELGTVVREHYIERWDTNDG